MKISVIVENSSETVTNIYMEFCTHTGTMQKCNSVEFDNFIFIGSNDIVESLKR